MKVHLGGVLAALVSFAVGTVLLLYNVKELAHAPLLLGAIVLFYLLGLLVAFPTNLTAAGSQLVAWYNAYRTGSGGAAA